MPRARTPLVLRMTRTSCRSHAAGHLRHDGGEQHAGTMMMTSVRRISRPRSSRGSSPRGHRPPRRSAPAMRPITTMTVMDCCAPRMVIANRSRPIRSWPNGCSPQASGHERGGGCAVVDQRRDLLVVVFPPAGDAQVAHRGEGEEEDQGKDDEPDDRAGCPRNRLRTIWPWLRPLDSRTGLDAGRRRTVQRGVLGHDFVLLAWLAHAFTLTRGSSAE